MTAKTIRETTIQPDPQPDSSPSKKSWKKAKKKSSEEEQSEEMDATIILKRRNDSGETKPKKFCPQPNPTTEKKKNHTSPKDTSQLSLPNCAPPQQSSK